MLAEPDFRSEWAAIEDAVQLRCEVCCISADDWHRSAMNVALPHVPARPDVRAHVSFCDEAQVFVGDALDLQMSSFCVPLAHISEWISSAVSHFSDVSDDASVVEPLSSAVLSPSLNALNTSPKMVHRPLYLFHDDRLLRLILYNSMFPRSLHWMTQLMIPQLIAKMVM